MYSWLFRSPILATQVWMPMISIVLGATSWYTWYFYTTKMYKKTDRIHNLQELVSPIFLCWTPLSLISYFFLPFMRLLYFLFVFAVIRNVFAVPIPSGQGDVNQNRSHPAGHGALSMLCWYATSAHLSLGPQCHCFRCFGQRPSSRSTNLKGVTSWLPVAFNWWLTFSQYIVQDVVQSWFKGIRFRNMKIRNFISAWWLFFVLYLLCLIILLERECVNENSQNSTS